MPEPEHTQQTSVLDEPTVTTLLEDARRSITQARLLSHLEGRPAKNSAFIALAYDAVQDAIDRQVLS